MREALSRVLICQYQQTHEPLWSAMLLVAYYPMLSRLRRCVARNPGRTRAAMVLLTRRVIG